MRLWRVSFREIENEWTDDQFFAMLQRANERAKKENKRIRKDTGGRSPGGGGGVQTRTSNYGIRELAAKAVQENGRR